MQPSFQMIFLWYTTSIIDIVVTFSYALIAPATFIVSRNHGLTMQDLASPSQCFPSGTTTCWSTCLCSHSFSLCYSYSLHHRPLILYLSLQIILWFNWLILRTKNRKIDARFCLSPPSDFLSLLFLSRSIPPS